MSTEPRTNSRAVAVLVGCGFLLLAAGVSWWAPWNNSNAPDLEPGPAKNVASDATPENATSALATALQPQSPPDTNDASPLRVTPQEIQKVQRDLAAARVLLHDIEAQQVKHVMTNNTEANRIDHVHLPALTRDQLDPVYTQLSQAGREFAPGSGAAKMFRQQADKFLESLRELPAKHVMRTVDKKAGTTSYAVAHLAEDASVSKGEDGAIHINSSHIQAAPNGKPEDVSHLFRGVFSD